MAKPATQSSDYKYTVSQEAIKHKGVSIGYFGNFRTDTRKCLGITSERYGLIQNGELLDVATQALSLRGLTDYEQRVIVTGEGQRMFAEFTFKNKQLTTAVGDIFGYKLTLRNSFDCSLRAALVLGFLRLTCLNGASTVEKEFGITQKHTGNVTAEFIAKAIDKAIAGGEQALKVYDRLAQAALTDEQGQNALKQLEAEKLLSGTLRQSMETLWLAPKRQEDKARNLYNLYNAITEHLTHQVAKERYEYANRLSAKILFKLVNAARKREYFDKLIQPVVIVSAPTDGTIIDAELV